MAAMATTFAKVSGFALIQKMMNTFCSNLERRNVPHWVEYLNSK